MEDTERIELINMVLDKERENKNLKEQIAEMQLLIDQANEKLKVHFSEVQRSLKI